MYHPKSLFIHTSILPALCLSACTATTQIRTDCASELDAGWRAMELAKADGFGGTASYAKAFSLLTSARTMQTVENFDNCYRHAKDAHFYIQQSRKG